MDRRWLLAGLVAVCAVTAGIWFGRGVRLPAPSSVTTVAAPEQTAVPPATTGGTIVVHVAGWVARPGLVSIGEGGRLADAVVAAGGLKAGAFVDDVNLAAVLTDGQQVTIPGPDAAGLDLTVPEEDGAVQADGRIRLNLATAGELEQLPGVGPVLAERIVAHREESGPFRRVEDLLDVSGIGEAKLAALRDLVVVP